MATATYEDALRVAQQLTPEEQRRLRDELDALLPGIGTPPREMSPTPSVRPGLFADLKVLDELAAQIGAAWQSDRNAAEAVNDQRR
jgi:hypothetical protein